MKLNWKSVLKIAAVTAAGAIVGSPDLQAAIVTAVPPPWNILVGMGFGFGALLLRSPATPAVTPPKPQPK